MPYKDKRTNRTKGQSHLLLTQLASSTTTTTGGGGESREKDATYHADPGKLRSSLRSSTASLVAPSSLGLLFPNTNTTTNNIINNIVQDDIEQHPQTENASANVPPTLPPIQEQGNHHDIETATRNDSPEDDDDDSVDDSEDDNSLQQIARAFKPKSPAAIAANPKNASAFGPAVNHHNHNHTKTDRQPHHGDRSNHHHHHHRDSNPNQNNNNNNDAHTHANTYATNKTTPSIYIPESRGGKMYCIGGILVAVIVVEMLVLKWTGVF